jgi:hypothetical protein
MILLYTMILFLLGAIKQMVALRARALERKFVKLALAVDNLLRQPEYKPGNSNKFDPCANAKKTLLLGQLVAERDRIEAKHFAWQRWTDRLTGWVNTAGDWKGKKLPYSMGAVDVWMILCLIDYFGVGQYVSTWNVLQIVMAWYSSE